MSTADEIAKLASLLEAGDITSEEFQSAKAQVLAEPTGHRESKEGNAASSDALVATKVGNSKVSDLGGPGRSTSLSATGRVLVSCGKCGFEEPAKMDSVGWKCGKCGSHWYITACANCQQANAVRDDSGKQHCASCGVVLTRSQEPLQDITIGDVLPRRRNDLNGSAGVLLETSPEDVHTIDNSRAWLLVVAPLLLTCIEAIFLFSGFVEGNSVGWVVAIAMNTLIVIWDNRYLKRHGIEVSALLGMLLVPIYLAYRSRRLKQSQFPLVAWMVVFVVSVVGSVVLEGHFVQLDMNRVTSQITTWVDNQASTTAIVRCPSQSVYAVQSTFDCSASDANGSATVQVTVQNSSGDVTWQIIG